MAKGYADPWTIRPDPYIKTFIDGLLAEGVYKSRSDAINALLEFATANMDLIPTGEPVDPGQQEDYVAVKVPLKAAVYLEMFTKSVTDTLNVSTRVKTIQTELHNIANRRKEIARQEEIIEANLTNARRYLGRPGTAIYEANSKRIERESARLNRLAKIKARIESHEKQLLEHLQTLEGTEPEA